MEVSSLPLLLLLLFLWVHHPHLAQNLVEEEARALFKIRRILEEPEAAREWTKWTNFCTINQSSSLSITCSNDNHLTQLTITGRGENSSLPPTKLSPNFSTTSFFNTLSRFPNLQLLSIVSLGIWGSIPPHISLLSSLRVLNLSSNYITGWIPSNITLLKNMTHLLISTNLLEGSIPDLSSMEQLRELDLSHNKLAGEFPPTSNLIQLINLSNNSMRSKLPSYLTSLHELHSLDISSNHFVGLLPPSLFSLGSIQYLNMAGNRLTGTLSPNTTCAGHLHFVDISDNLLTGELPVCLVQQEGNIVVHSDWNCLLNLDKMHQHQNQHQPYFCNRGALAALPFREDDKKRHQTGMKLWVVVVPTVGAAAAGAAVLAYLASTRLKSVKKLSCGKGSVGGAIADGGNSPDELKTFTFPGTMRSAALGLPPYRIFSLEEIEEATNHFHPTTLTSQTPWEKSYRGWLRNGAPVTVRMEVKKIGKEWLTQYIEQVSKLRHENLISVLGHCCVRTGEEDVEILVVVERVVQASLEDHLSDGSKREALKWPQRMGMMMGIARGIQFLHTGISPGIFGIVLYTNLIVVGDDNLTPKISGYSMPSSFKYIQGKTKRLKSSEDGGRGMDLDKDDVYQMGRLMVELITGRVMSSAVEVEVVRRQMEFNHNWGEVVDPVMEGTFAHQSVRTMVEVAMGCVGPAEGRPSMEDILWNMHYSCQIQHAWSSSNLNSAV